MKIYTLGHDRFTEAQQKQIQDAYQHLFVNVVAHCYQCNDEYIARITIQQAIERARERIADLIFQDAFDITSSGRIRFNADDTTIKRFHFCRDCHIEQMDEHRDVEETDEDEE